MDNSVESLLQQSFAVQEEIKSLANELGQLHRDLEQEVTEFCNIEKTSDKDPREVTMDMSTFLSSRLAHGKGSG